jgi:hypothetical protein
VDQDHFSIHPILAELKRSVEMTFTILYLSNKFIIHMKHLVTSLFRVLTFSALISCSSGSSTETFNEEWIPIFNGKDLSGWDIKIAGYDLNDNFNETFRVEDSILKVDYSKYAKFENKFGHLYYNKPYSYYRVKLQYRFTDKQLKDGPDYAYLNSGIMLHSQSAASLGKAQTFPVSLEMQFLASNDSVKRTTGNLCTPGTQVSRNGAVVSAHCIDSSSPNYDEELWISAEAIVLGDSIVHHVIEGDTVLTYENTQVGGGFVNKDMNWRTGGFADSVLWGQKQNTPLKEGYIALQAESHPIEFRKIELLDLKGCKDPKAVNYKSYYVKSDPSQCRYK